MTFKVAFAFLVKITRNSNNKKRIKRKVVSYVDENFKSGFEVDFTFICVWVLNEMFTVAKFDNEAQNQYNSIWLTLIIMKLLGNVCYR